MLGRDGGLPYDQLLPTDCQSICAVPVEDMTAMHSQGDEIQGIGRSVYLPARFD